MPIHTTTEATSSTTSQVLDEVTSHTEFGAQLAMVGMPQVSSPIPTPPPHIHIADEDGEYEEFQYEYEDIFDVESTYSREDVLNIFPVRHQGFVTEIMLSFQEGEMIDNIDLYEILGHFGLTIPGFELTYDSVANPDDSFNTSFEDVATVPVSASAPPEPVMYSHPIVYALN